MLVFAIVVLSNKRLFFFFTFQNGRTPLIWGAEEGHTDVVSLLLSAGANKEAANKVILMTHYCIAI